MEYERLDRRAIISWRIGRIIGMVIVIIIFSIGIFIVRNFSFYQKIGTYVYSAAGLIIAYMLFGIIVYPIIEYRQWRYAISEDKVEIKHGIFFIAASIIPIIRIQHISVSQGPINRKLGLYDVTISLASGSFHIECLTKEKAEMISEYLKNKLYTRLKLKGEHL
jgi:membrane protein YdbS with pleckstrin-like domain